MSQVFVAALSKVRESMRLSLPMSYLWQTHVHKLTTIERRAFPTMAPETVMVPNIIVVFLKTALWSHTNLLRR